MISVSNQHRFLKRISCTVLVLFFWIALIPFGSASANALDQKPTDFILKKDSCETQNGASEKIRIAQSPKASLENSAPCLMARIRILSDQKTNEYLVELQINIGNRTWAYFCARYYHAQLGRFISRDPLGFVDGMSLYRAYFVPDGMDAMGLGVYKVGSEDTPNPHPVDNSLFGSEKHNMPFFDWNFTLARADGTSAGGYVLGWWNAAGLLDHYIGSDTLTGLGVGTGTPYKINYSELIEDSAQAKAHHLSELQDLKEAAKKFAVAGQVVTIVTEKEVQTQVTDDMDWFNSIAGYRTWGRARVECHEGWFIVNWEQHLRDVYDFENQNKPGGLVTDAEMYKLHVWGLARNFEVYGSRKSNWKFQ